MNNELSLPIDQSPRSIAERHTSIQEYRKGQKNLNSLSIIQNSPLEGKESGRSVENEYGSLPLKHVSANKKHALSPRKQGYHTVR